MVSTPPKLYIGKNDKVLDWKDMRTLTTPSGTSSWQPVSHYEFVKLVKDSLASLDITVRDEQHGVTDNGDRYFGLLAVDQEGSAQKDYHTMIGLRNSHDKRFSLGLAWGARVMVCSNLSFTGEVVIRRKHTRLIKEHLPELVYNAVTEITAMEEEQETRFNMYKTYHTSYKDDVDHLLISCLRESVISSSQVGQVIKEWEDHKDKEQTIWRFFNACTSVLRDRISTESMVSKTTRLQQLVLDPYCLCS